MIAALRTVIKRMHYRLEVMLTCVRGYVSYPLSFRHLEEMMEERGVVVDHATIPRWAIKIVPVLAAVFRRRKRPVGKSWRIELRQCQYLNNIVEQDHRAIKRIVRPMLGFKVFRCARILIAGIETMHMIRKAQIDGDHGEVLSAADQFYSLGFLIALINAPSLSLHRLLRQNRFWWPASGSIEWFCLRLQLVQQIVSKVVAGV